MEEESWLLTSVTSPNSSEDKVGTGMGMPDSTPPRWCPATGYGRGERILGNHGRWLIAECAGMSRCGSMSLDEPHWPEMEGCTTVDGTIVWKCEGFSGIQPEWAKTLAAEWAAHLASVYLSPDDKPMFNMNGNPISQSCKAKEATPKYEPPLFEEREV